MRNGDAHALFEAITTLAGGFKKLTEAHNSLFDRVEALEKAKHDRTAECAELLWQRDEAVKRVAELENECMMMAHTLTTMDNPDPDAHIADQEEYLKAKQKRVEDAGSWTEQDIKDFEGTTNT